MISNQERGKDLKARYIGCIHDGWEHTELEYEYRGHKYFVTKHNNGYMDKSLRQQHEEEQKRIDEQIEHKDDPIPEWKYEGSCQEGFDMFWEYVNQ